MSFTYRIRPGDPLSADNTEQNFDDLRSSVNASVGSLQVEEGAVHTRHLETATPFKNLGIASTTSTTALSGTPQVVLPSSSAPFTTFNTQAYLVRAVVQVHSTGSTPHCILRIKVGGSSVIERYWALSASSTQVVKIAWLAVASGSSTTVEIEAEGSNSSVTKGTLTVLAVTR